MKRNYTIKGFEYKRQGIKPELPIEVLHKGKKYKFATAILRKAIELKDTGINVLCIRIMKTLTHEDTWQCGFGAPIPQRTVLNEYFYSEIKS